jgi:hypothetical protein
MAMSRRSSRELRKLRELVRCALAGKTCFFCHLPLLENVDDGWQGSGSAPPISERLTIHHKNGNHEDNRDENHALAHRTCHKIHHMHEVRPWAVRHTAKAG